MPSLLTTSRESALTQTTPGSRTRSFLFTVDCARQATGDALPVILIVDDNPDDAFLTRRRIVGSGARNPIVCIESGERAIAYLNAATIPKALEYGMRPRAIFLDVQMPRIDGFEVLAWIRAQKQLSEVPVVMLTSSEDPAHSRKARALGATDFWIKHPPVQDFAKLLGRLT